MYCEYWIDDEPLDCQDYECEEDETWYGFFRFWALRLVDVARINLRKLPDHFL